ncbi:MAG: hypothetical protein JWQ76_5778 [Ramlibacter sp.]|nr:hypothetical protein [Ramlibacter sp.]
MGFRQVDVKQGNVERLELRGPGDPTYLRVAINLYDRNEATFFSQIIWRRDNVIGGNCVAAFGDEERCAKERTGLKKDAIVTRVN